eukprot:10466097-Alexandrium_andersonii.AAC.1
MSARPSARAHRWRWGNHARRSDGRVPGVPPRPMQAECARGQEPTPARAPGPSAAASSTDR